MNWHLLIPIAGLLLAVAVVGWLWALALDRSQSLSGEQRRRLRPRD